VHGRKTNPSNLHYALTTDTVSIFGELIGPAFRSLFPCGHATKRYNEILRFGSGWQRAGGVNAFPFSNRWLLSAARRNSRKGIAMKYLEVIDCRDYRAVPDDGKYDDAGLNAAWADAVKHRRPLWLPSGTYHLQHPVSWLGTDRIPHVLAHDASLVYYGHAAPAVTYGGRPGSTAVYGRIDGLHITIGGDPSARCLMLQNLMDSHFSLGVLDCQNIATFTVGLHLCGDGVACGYNTIEHLAVSSCHTSIYVSTKGGGWVNKITFSQCRFGTAYCMISVDPAVRSCDDWSLRDCSFETKGETILLAAKYAYYWLMDGCYFEAPEATPMTTQIESGSVVLHRPQGPWARSLVIPPSSVVTA
jgi:hypothetical protein